MLFGLNQVSFLLLKWFHCSLDLIFIYLIVQCLNQLHHCIPPYNVYTLTK